MSQLYNRSFAIAVLSQSGFVMANLLMAHYARWITFLRGDVRDVGWIMGIGAVGALVLRPWMAQWLNRIGARNMWAIGYGFFLVGSLGNLFVHDVHGAVYFLRTCLTLGVACVSSSSLTYISQMAPIDRQTEAIGILGVGGFLAFSIGPYVGDLILGPTEQRTREDFMFLFLTAGGLLVVPSILLLFLPSTGGDVRTSPTRLINFIRTVYQHWPGMILVVLFMFGVCMTVPFAFLAEFIDVRHLDIPHFSEIGVYFLCYALIGLSIRIFMRRVPDRLGQRPVLFMGMAAMASGMFCFLLVDAEHPWRLVLPGLLCGAGHGLMFHTGTALVLESFPIAVRGTGSALSFMMLDLGLMAGAPILGQIAEWYGFSALFASIGTLCIAVALLYAMSLPIKR